MKENRKTLDRIKDLEVAASETGSQDPVGGGLEGTQYVFVAADGTDVENAAELVDAYDEAKTKVQITQMPGDNIIETVFFGFTQTINNGNNFWFYFNDLPNPIPLGVQNVEVVSNEFTGTIEIDVTDSDIFSLQFNYSGTPLTNVTAFKVFIVEVKRAVVIAAPGNYNFESDFVMDTEYVDLVSLDGRRSIVFNGAGTISITANDVLVKGVDVLNKGFTIGDDLNLLKVENCAGGNNSFGSSGTVSGTFTDCKGRDFSFGGFGVASGIFTNCQGGTISLGANVASGIFTNCVTSAGFGSNGLASGTFTNCVATDPFNGAFGRTASGIFNNCQGGAFSFGYGFQATAPGTFTNCTAGEKSFGFDGGTLTGKLYYCRLTSGTFPTVSGAGITRLCIDGNNVENNQG